MHKVLLLLGMLLDGPLYGHQMHQIVRAHGELYADLKKANMYYLLEHLAKDGYLEVEAEPGTRGARGERLIYAITNRGREHFLQVLRQTLLSYETVHTGIETAMVFLSYLTPEEGLHLLKERRHTIQDRRAQVVTELGRSESNSPLVVVAGDHLVSLIDAELAWIERSLAYLEQVGWINQPTSSSPSEQARHTVNQTRPSDQPT